MAPIPKRARTEQDKIEPTAQPSTGARSFTTRALSRSPRSRQSRAMLVAARNSQGFAFCACAIATARLKCAVELGVGTVIRLVADEAKGRPA